MADIANKYYNMEIPTFQRPTAVHTLASGYQFHSKMGRTVDYTSLEDLYITYVYVV
jgi:hypothetical protein